MLSAQPLKRHNVLCYLLIVITHHHHHDQFSVSCRYCQAVQIFLAPFLDVIYPFPIRLSTSSLPIHDCQHQTFYFSAVLYSAYSRPNRPNFLFITGCIINCHICNYCNYLPYSTLRFEEPAYDSEYHYRRRSPSPTRYLSSLRYNYDSQFEDGYLSPERSDWRINRGLRRNRSLERLDRGNTFHGYSVSVQ